MRRGRRGKPHPLCPPCPPIGQSGGPGAGPSGSEAETNTQGAEQSSPRGAKAVYSRARCAGQRVSWSCQPRVRLYYGQSAAAPRALSRTEELCHRSARSARSQDRSREALSRGGSRHCTKPVSSVWLRGASTVQCDRICVPRVCLNQSYREPKQGRRHCVAHLLGGVRPVRAGGVLQRSTPVLVPFLLRGQVRLPVILHDARAQERCPAPVQPGGAPAVPQASRGPRQRLQSLGSKSSRRSSWNHSGRQAKSEPATETQVKPQPSQCTDPPASNKGQAAEPKTSTDSETESRPMPSCPSKPTRIPSHATPGLSRPQSAESPSSMAQMVTRPASHHQVSNKPRGQQKLRGSASIRRAGLFSTSSRLSQPVGQTSGGTQMPLWTSGSSQPAGRSTGAAQGLSVSDPATPMVQSPNAIEVPVQPATKAPTDPEDSAPKSSCKGQKRDLANSTSVSELIVPCHSKSSLDYLSESTTEISCHWPNGAHQLYCPWHCWLFQHMAY